MSKKIKDEQKKFLGETLNQYDKALDEAINQLDKKNREQNHKISSLVNSFDNEYLEKDVEGNMTTLENSKDGMVIINEIQGNTEVNYCKDGEKELILNGDIDTQGESFVTLTEGVDGGLVDVSLEGNTEINLSSTKDPVLVTREFDDINCNIGKLQYTIDDVTTINDEPGKVDIDRIVGDTMVNHAVNGSEELILNAHINESGDNNITLNGVTSDGGKVDVALEGNTLVNVSKTKDITPITKEGEDVTGNHVSLVDEGSIRPVLNGNTMVNVCDQKDPVAITKSYTVETGNHIALQGEYDGKCRPVIYGNTLVNLFNDNNFSKYNYGDLAVWDGNIFKITQEITSDKGNIASLTYKGSILKQDTVYTFIIRTKGNFTGFIFDNDFTTQVNNEGDGIHKLTFTYNGSSTDAYRLWIGTSTPTNLEVEFLMLLEGDYTNKPTPEYFSGLQSSFEDKVVTQEMVDNGEELAENLGKYKVDYRVIGKNKFDKNLDKTDGYYLNGADGSIIALPGYCVMEEYVRIQPNTTYYGTNMNHIAIYDKDKNFITREGLWNDTKTFTTPSNAYYCRFQFGSNDDLSIVQLEEGTEATSYEPYKEYKKTFYLNSPLLEGDTIEQQGDNVVHVYRYGKVVFDGNTNIPTAFNMGNDCYRWNFYDDKIGNVNSLEIYTINNKYPDVSAQNMWDNHSEGVAQNGGGNLLLLYLEKYSDGSNNSKQALMSELQSNPVTVVYKLQTPQYEVISQNDTILCDSYVNGHLDVDSVVPIKRVNFMPTQLSPLKYVYEKTKYTLQFESDNVGKIDYLMIGQETKVNIDVIKGINKINITTATTSPYVDFRGIGFNASNIVVTPAIEQDFGYFSGIQSCFEDNLVTEGEYAGKYKVDYKVTGKNKFDKSKGVEIGWVDSVGNVCTTTSDCRTSYYIPVIPNTTYFTNNPANETTAFYDINKKFISFKMDKSFTTPSNCYYVRCTIKTPNFENNFQLEEGTEATPYEPYKEYTKTLYLNSPLLEGDTIEEKDGNIYHVHRYGKVENVTRIIETVNENRPNYEYLADINCVLYKISQDYYDKYVYSDKLSSLNDVVKPYEKITGANQIYINETSMWVSCDKNKTTDEFISFINSCNIIAKLATPQYELIQQSGTIAMPTYSAGHLDVTSAVPVDKVNFLHFEEELVYLYPSTQYIVQFTSDKATTADITLGGTQLLKQSIVKGLNKITITTPETLVDNKLIIDGVGVNISEVVVTNSDRDFGYFEGMKSVGECEDLEVVSSNSDGTLSNTQTLTHEPLRAVGDIKDKYVLIDGKWYIERNTAIGIIDGTSQGRTNPTYLRGNEFIMFTKRSDHPVKIKDSSVVSDFYKTYKDWSTMYHDTSGEGVSNVDSALGIGIRISNSKTGITSDDTAQQLTEKLLNYFQANPVKIVYQLDTPQYEPIDYNPLEVYSDVTHISNNSTIPCNMIIKNHGYNTVALKENTQYTLYVDKNTTNALTYRLGDYVEINSLSKFTFTIPATLTDKTLRIDGKGTKVNDLMLIEGTPANNPVGYFDGLKSSYECEQVTDENNENYGKYKVDIKVVGKNKFDGQWQRAEGVYGVYYYGKGTYTISIQEKDLSLLDNRYSLGHANLDGSNVDWLYSDGTIWRHSRTLTNGKLVFRMPTEEGFELLKRAFDIQLEEGDTATEYEPYFESKQTIYLNSPLLKGDEIVWKDNKIQHYHKMETVVFDGSDDEGWIKQGDDWDTDNRIVFKISLPKSNLQWHALENEINTSQNRTSKKVLSDKFTYIYNIPNESVNKFIGQDGDIGNFGLSARYLVIGLLKAELQTQNIAGFKQWLQQNPVKVVYQLAEPTYEEISDYPLKLNAIANSSLSTESTIQVTNISFNVYEETLPYLYPNTKYYITFNADVDRNNIVIDLGGSHIVFDCKVGFNKVKITTPSNTTNLLTFSGTGVNIDHVKVTQQDIDEYFEGMKSVGECENNTLEIICKNNDNSKSNTQTLTHEPLRAVGDIKDKYVLIDGKWYIERNCGEVVLDGSEDEDWAYSPSTNPGHCYITLSNINIYSYNNFICDKLLKATINPSLSETSNNYGISMINVSTNAQIKIRLTSNDTLSSVMEYLKINSIKIVYRLKTPTYELIDYNPFEVYSDITHISNNSLIPSNMVIKNHGYNTILKPSTKYTIALNKSDRTIGASLGGSAKVESSNNVFTITTPSTLTDNCLRLYGKGIKSKDVMILEGNKTNYIPGYFEGLESAFEQEYDEEKGKYKVKIRVQNEDASKENYIEFYINEPLRGIRDVKDRVYIKDNKVIVERNCASVTLDGSEDENWSMQRDIYGKYRVFNSNKYTYNNRYSYGYSKYFPSVPYGAIGYDYTGEGCGLENNNLRISIANAKLSSVTVAGFKQWLQQNPTTVVYQLAEPTYEEADCDLSKLVLENYSNSSLILDTNIPPTVDVKYSGEVPIVSQAKSLSSQVDNTTLDINENIIPYMCDIDYRIVELQLMNGDTQGEGIELLGIGDIEILSNENVLFNNREDKKYNYSYDMLKRDILSQRYSKEEYQYRLDRYLLANKISDEEYKELEGLLNNGE